MPELTPAEIEHSARARALAQHLPYAGAVTPPEAYAWVQAASAVWIIDVRTQAEWQWVGQPVLAPTQYGKIEWNQASTGQRNPDFLAQLQRQVLPGSTLLMLCRSGARSHSAAEFAQQSGFQAFNILEGFEGDKNAANQRNAVNGWRWHKLPWIQS